MDAELLARVIQRYRDFGLPGPQGFSPWVLPSGATPLTFPTAVVEAPLRPEPRFRPLDFYGRRAGTPRNVPASRRSASLLGELPRAGQEHPSQQRSTGAIDIDRLNSFRDFSREVASRRIAVTAPNPQRLSRATLAKIADVQAFNPPKSDEQMAAEELLRAQGMDPTAW